MKLLMILLFPCCLMASFASGQDYSLSKKDTSDVRFINKKKFYIYKVEKGETLYSLCKKFQVTEAELLEFNPDLKDGLKNKMKLWIPASAFPAIQAPVIEKAAEVEVKDAPLEIALLLPLRIEHNYVTGDLLNDTLVLNEGLDKETASSLEFYEGLIFALDELAKSKNLKAKVHVYDTQDDTLNISKLLKGPALQKADVWIAAGNSSVIKLVNQYSVAFKLPLVSVSMNSADHLKGNSEAVATMPSSLTQCRQMGRACAVLFSGAQCVLLNTSIAKENDRSKAFKSGWVEEGKSEAVREISFTKEYGPVLRDSLSSLKPNLLFVPSSNEDFVSSLMTELISVPAEKKFTIVGIPTWQYFETIDPALMEKMNTYLFATSNIDYENSSALLFRKYFRDTYGNEPSDHAYQGHDCMQLLGNAWLKGGKDFLEKLEKENYRGLFTNYHFSNANGIYENDFIYVLHYKDLNLERVESIIK